MLSNRMTDNDNHNIANNNNNINQQLQHPHQQQEHGDDDNSVSNASSHININANDTNNNNENNTTNNNVNNNNNNSNDNINENDKNIEIELRNNIENVISPPAKPLKSILRLKTPEIYQEPTPTPLPNLQITAFNTQANQKSTAPSKPPKKKRVDKNDLGDDFVAPDGGWGWVVAVASGINILVTFAMAQQFGIIFREHLANMGVNSSELTTIINIQVAISALTGLLNGPIFRNFTYRQVALFGSVITFAGLVLLVFADSFATFVCFFSVMYAFGRGMTTSASSLAVNTYFKLKRRNATAYQFAVAGLGPIFYPYLATFLMSFYGVRGTVLVFAAIALNTVACSLLYQPVLWHVKKPTLSEVEKVPPTPELEHDVAEQVVEPDTPVLARANDGWFGSRTSLSTSNLRNRLSMIERENDMYYGQVTELKRLNSRDRSRAVSITPSTIAEEEDEEVFDYNEFMPKKTRLPEGVAYQPPKTPDPEFYELGEEARQKLPFYKKVIIFFDLDLLRDVTYVNLASGLMIINFVEINFAILTPFILSDFGFNANQIAFAMSSLGFCDLVLRFLIPAITFKLTRLSNKFFFSVGILGMCIGRFFLAFTRDFYMLVAVFLFLGICKAFRTIFWTLIIPSYVPLKRLPAASGLQLLMSGIFSMIFGPIIGLIRDNTNYVVTLIVLNLICMVALLLWGVEWLLRRSKNKSKTIPDDIKS